MWNTSIFHDTRSIDCDAPDVGGTGETGRAFSQQPRAKPSRVGESELALRQQRSQLIARDR